MFRAVQGRGDCGNAAPVGAMTRIATAVENDAHLFRHKIFRADLLSLPLDQAEINSVLGGIADTAARGGGAQTNKQEQ